MWLARCRMLWYPRVITSYMQSIKRNMQSIKPNKRIQVICSQWRGPQVAKYNFGREDRSWHKSSAAEEVEKSQPAAFGGILPPFLVYRPSPPTTIFSIPSNVADWGFQLSFGRRILRGFVPAPSSLLAVSMFRFCRSEIRRKYRLCGHVGRKILVRRTTLCYPPFFKLP